MPDTIFTVTPDQLANLGPERGVGFLRDLFFAEARGLGVSLHQVVVPSEIDTADGGIDASIEEAPASLSSGIIFPGTTKYQIKAGSFSLGDKDNRKSLLYSKGILKPRIKECFDKGETFAVVLLGDDSPKKDEWLTKIRAELPAEYRDAKIKIIQQGNIITALKPHLALALRVNGRAGASLFTRDEWGTHEQQDLRHALQMGEAQSNLLEEVSKSLLEAQAVPLRILGDAGIGKTRLVYEATKNEKISPMVLYTQAENFLKDAEFQAMLKRHECDFNAVLVVDECDYDDANNVWKYIRPHSGKIRLITISNDERTEKSEGWQEWKLEALPNDQIAAIFKNTYGMPDRNAERWASLCAGYPRFAHLVGKGVRDNPENLNKSPNIDQAINKMIAGRDAEASSNFERRKKVLMHLSLFMRFGFGGPFEKETNAVVALIQGVDPAITKSECERYIQELTSLKLIQGRFTHYITPKILHLRLWHEWWALHGDAFKLQPFLAQLTPDLERWFVEMFQYAAGSDQTRELAKRLMAEGGPCDSDFFFENEHLVKFFRILTPLSPHSALRILQKRLVKMSRDELLKLHKGRREIIYALSDIAVRRELFLDAARLLLQLADAENESWANNATGVFADLFTPVHGEWASSEAGPIERLPVLEEALNSPSKNKRLAALKAFDVALESQMFSRITGVHDNVFEQTAQKWTPKTYGEIWNAYIEVWKLLRSNIEKFPPDERVRAAEILLNNSTGIGRIKKISPLVVETLEELANKPYVGKKPVMEKIAWFLRYGVKDLRDKEIKELWQALETKLMDSSFAGRMERFVGMNLLEDIFDDKGKQTDKGTAAIIKLAAETIKNPGLLQPELKWLVRRGTANADVYGFQLGERDAQLKMLPAIESAYTEKEGSTSTDLLCGYLRALNQRNPQECYKVINGYRNHPLLKSRMPELLIRSSSLNNDSASLILSLAEEGSIKPADFRQFTFSKAVASLNEEIILGWVKWLKEQPGLVGISYAVDVVWSYYLHKDEARKLPPQVILELLMDKRWLEMPEDSGIDKSFIDGIWKEVAVAFVKQNPKNIDEISRHILSNLGKEDSLFDGYGPDALEVLDTAAQINPHNFWKLITAQIESDDGDSMHPYRIRQWLHGQDMGRYGPGIALMDPKDVFEWVDKDPEERAPLIASVVPKVIFYPEKGQMCWAREVLVRYGEMKSVRSQLHGNFGTDSWSGPASQHYAGKLERSTKLRERETNPNVIKWLDEKIAGLQSQIEDAKIREERDDY